MTAAGCGVSTRACRAEIRLDAISASFSLKLRIQRYNRFAWYTDSGARA